MSKLFYNSVASRVRLLLCSHSSLIYFNIICQGQIFQWNDLYFLLCYCFKGVEWTCTSKRGFVSIAGLCFYSIGLMVMSGVAYFVRNWRILHLVFSSPVILFILTVYWSVNPSVLQWYPEPLTSNYLKYITLIIMSHCHFALRLVISHLLLSWIIYHNVS